MTDEHDRVCLTAEAVADVARDCLYQTDELTDDAIPEGGVVVEGVVNKFCFHPERIRAQDATIRKLLAELPDRFREGDSFVNACYTRADQHWGEHRDMEMLFALGMGIGAVECLMPRDLWGMLPGGVPYLRVTL